MWSHSEILPHGVERHHFAHGTYLDARYPFGLMVGGAAICSDGKVRRLKRIATTSDTFFSTPAAVRVGKRTVSGYVTVETASGSSVASEGDPATLKFVAARYLQNHDALPVRTWNLPTDADVRRLASDWHGGGNTALYALASSGAIVADECERQIGHALQSVAEISWQANELRDLLTYVRHYGTRDAVEGWVDISW